VQKYLKRKFGDALEDISRAMRELASLCRLIPAMTFP